MKMKLVLILILVFSLAVSVFGKQQTGKIIAVASGDMFEIETEEEIIIVKLYDAECMENFEAMEYSEENFVGKTVKFEIKGVAKFEKVFRTLGTIMVITEENEKEKLVNISSLLIKSGFSPKGVRYNDGELYLKEIDGSGKMIYQKI